MSTATNGGDYIVTEVPNALKLLARMILRGFYSIEDALIIDLLVRNPCMKEDDIAELLRFERKQLRARIATLRADKFIQMRLKMETGPDGKAQKVNYYFINYKTFVNVVKYKLDLIRKRMETEERDATSRASFKCNNCLKTFTDLEADQLFDISTHEFRCTFCLSIVEEDSSALPKKDSRLMLARFNEQMQPLYDLLRETEGIKLAPELLEPEPVDINTIRGLKKPSMPRYDGQQWSGEATRNSGFSVEDTRVDVSIMGDDVQETVIERKDRPIWMTESTVFTEDTGDNSLLADASLSHSQPSSSGTTNNRNRKDIEDTMSLLLMYEPKTNQADILKHKNPNDSSSDSEDDDDIENAKIPDIDFNQKSESEDSDVDVPTVLVTGRPYPLNQINDSLIEQMTPQEKENYILVYQQQYSYIYDL